MNKATFFWLIYLISFFSSCLNNKLEPIRYNKSQSNITKIDTINLTNSQQKYSEVIANMLNKICSGNSVKLRFLDETIYKELFPVNQCEITKWDPLKRDIISIDSNGIATKNDLEYSLEELDMLFKKDFMNVESDSNYCLNSEKLIIIVNLNDEQKVDRLSEILNAITKAYDKIRTNVSLKILLNPNIKAPVK